MKIPITILTQEERSARWRATYEWHDWFAWHPVAIPGVGIVWLETVQRQYESGYSGGGWNYRASGE